MKMFFRCCGLVMATWTLAQPIALGQTAIVNPDGTGDFTTIQAAINSSGFEPEILVFPGQYDENIVITRGVKLRTLEGPYFTCIRGDISADTVTFDRGVDAQIIGFSITNGQNGVMVNSTAIAQIKNCVIYDNMQSGILAQGILNETPTDLEVINNVIQNNDADGIRLLGGAPFNDTGPNAFPTLIQNNIVLGNQGFVVQVINASLQSTSRIDFPELLDIDYNNSTENWGSRIGAGGDVDLGPNNIQGTPGYIGQLGGCGPDVRLVVGSAMVDAGNPGPAFRDADSSVNDIGAFGGPDAASFFESPFDGPIVRSVTLTPAVVPQGETFSVEAVVAVR